jgi:rhodanese-related sulfurtransferase
VCIYACVAVVLFDVWNGRGGPQHILVLKVLCLSGVGALDAEQAAKFLKDDRVKYVIDVRTLMEWNMGHHKDAIHVPVTEFRADHPKFRNISRSAGVLLYCNTGQRARYAAELMRSYGFKNVYYLTGGY